MSDLLGVLKLGGSALLPVLTAAVCGAWMRDLPSWEEAPLSWALAWLGLLCCAWYVFDHFFYCFSLGKKMGEVAWIEREGKAHLALLQKFVDAMQAKGGQDGE